MKLRVQHRTEYLYSQPVRQNTNEVRLQPPHTPWQQREFWILRVLPAARLNHFTDLHSNAVSWFEVEQPHSRLLIESTAIVHTSSQYRNGLPAGIPMSSLAAAQEDSTVAGFLGSSHYVEITPGIWKAAVDIQVEQDDVFGTALGIMKWIHRTCRYEPGVTGVSTGSREFFGQMAGVCQDFAHLMLAMCRSIGVPARYVSGYLYDPGRRDFRGTHASHAWVEVYVPGHGWFGLDPTNNRLADELCITVATGRDYHDVAPIRGTFIGAGSRRMNVHVWVEPL